MKGLITGLVFNCIRIQEESVEEQRRTIGSYQSSLTKLLHDVYKPGVKQFVCVYSIQEIQMVPLWNDFVMHQILDLRLQSLIVTRVTKTIAGSYEQKGGSGHVFHVTQWSGSLWERRELMTVYVGLFVLGAMYWLLRLFDFKSTTRTKNFIKIVLIEATTASDEIYFYAVQISRTANLRIRSTSLEPLSGEGHPFT